MSIQKIDIRQRKLISRNWRSRRGQAIVETAVVISLLVLIVTGIIQFGYNYYLVGTMSGSNNNFNFNSNYLPATGAPKVILYQ